MVLLTLASHKILEVVIIQHQLILQDLFYCTCIALETTLKHAKINISVVKGYDKIMQGCSRAVAKLCTMNTVGTPL